jgi:peroxiredoxin
VTGRLLAQICLLLLCARDGFCSNWRPSEGSDLIGKKAPEFAGLVWVESKPLTLSSLRGKAVFVRFWLGECPMCLQSMPTLNYLANTYARRGLVVIGIHHPKGVSCSLEEPAAMEHLINQLNLKFPVALDNDWKTIDQYWTDKRRDFTSASMLIDRKGVIRWVHPGGLLELPPSLGGREESPAFESLEHILETVLREKV